MSTVPAPTIARRHDLDALRAIAMLMGIALHAMISFLPGPGGGWAVQDTQTNGWFAIAMAVIHGFRMPLFFLISGFFTMMLLRKRGMAALLKQRFVRIFVPFLLGMFTIIPAVWAVSIYVGIKTQTAAMQPAQVETESGHDAAIAASSQSGWMAAATGNVEAVRQWIAQGGDVHHREEDGSTALHGAFLFGRSEVASVLIQSGADPNTKNRRGESCIEMLGVPWGMTAYVAGLTKVTANENDVLEGRRRIAGSLHLPATDQNQIARRETTFDKLKFAMFYFPVTGHLWFLWFLCWLVTGFSICVAIGRLLRIPRPSRWLTASAFRFVWVIPLTMIPQAFMTGEGIGFGPDTSIGILPMPSVLAYYAIFFAFGAMYFDASGLERNHDQGGWRSWAAMCVSLLVFFPLAMAIRTPVSPGLRIASLFLQATYAWLMTFGMMGAFSHLLSRESKTMRYLSDSSYWLYLSHIPIVIYLQYWVRDYTLPSTLKFGLVCLVTSVILLLSYHLFVRYTPIGTLLNGKRIRQKNSTMLPSSTSSGKSGDAHIVIGAEGNT